MGKRTARSLYGLAIFVCLLYFAKVSTDSINKSIKYIMENDEELHPVPVFLYTNTSISTCANVSYPEGIIKPDYTYKNTFLCLAFYDTWFKVCKSSLLWDWFNKNVTDAKTFNNYLLKFVPKENNNNSEAMFCESIKGVTFLHKKLKPFLSHLKNFNDYDTCHPICFDMDKNFTPLCEILAWSKNLDNNIQNVNNESQTELQITKTEKLQKSYKAGENPKVQNPPIESQVTKNKSHSGLNSNDENNKGKGDAANKEKAKPPNSDKKPVEIPIVKPNPEEDTKTVQGMTEIDNKDLKNVNKQPHNNKEESQNVNEQAHSDKQESKNINEESKETQHVNEGTHSGVKEFQDTNKESEDLPVNTAKENNEESAKEINNEEKTMEWNNGEDNGLMDDQNNTGEPDASIDTDQPQNIHKSAVVNENVSSFRTMRTDEESHFFTYFTILSLISIAAYIGYYNKQKILAIVLEGRRSRNSRGRRRPSTANYRKLDCTLEEAVTSQCNANVTHVIY